MGKILNLRNWKKEKGLSIAEVVVAIGVVVIVSVAVVSIASYSTNATSNANVKRFFNHEVNSMLMVYLSSDDETQFKKGMNAYYGSEIGYEDTTIYYKSDFSYAENEASSSYYINLDFGSNSLVLSAYKKSGNIILSKGAER